eukprot:TRINITY_DN5066_c0_g1_i1.p1 TRINITY_DN5066_c0_g1~~TRINITY_DN5066_c0_g1_i1.p1  ORF type:complete len:333 (-),score=48.57 TRINITY_DN5066_c0_g1_i1:64-1062(-)
MCSAALQRASPGMVGDNFENFVIPGIVQGTEKVSLADSADAKENWQPNISADVQKTVFGDARSSLGQRSIQEPSGQSDGLRALSAVPPRASCNSSLRLSAACDVIPPLPTCAISLPLPPMQPPPPCTPPRELLCQLSAEDMIPALPTARSAAAESSVTPAGTAHYLSARSARSALGALYMYTVPEAEAEAQAPGNKRAVSSSCKRNAVAEGYMSLTPANVFSAARHGRYREVNLALASGFRATYADSHGNTVFHVACQNGHKAIAKLAIKYGGDWNARNAKGNTGLHYLFTYGYADIGDYFIEKGAREDIQNNLGNVARQGICDAQFVSDAC